ncbi:MULTISPECIES: HD-GYP domain-containing protein [unclassified Ruminococcus]|uniref:HD-GYP domain-containing protein n=1 Tax=unclassified Ruminococcus TaxID=2608920 RepID=UPI00189EA637|nr:MULTISPECIES: HD-GYP domain-containing protein [unclassified Ruminococcus]MDB8757046.1 HD-GYP domain-containing protein [Ruminococcus sp. 1001136sp1]MDB8761011.1 HD-GYP domain-containing protein [Ruminococcus sp. 1001136sp1]MDB8765243.1 HD-GYP domain-containing protein [Ruminococcus sp. 1001136sp1]MDB8769143.1 HD-GYP domain-containing protein [Ruminococcus sp. 1001136sp1]
MVQLFTFFIAQVIFLPVYLQTTDICTEGKATKVQRFLYILISPFSAYIYINLLFMILSVCLPSDIFNHFISTSDILIILMSFLFVHIYNRLSMEIEDWSKTYYASIYFSFFLLETAFSCVYNTLLGSVIFNIAVPVLVISLYRKLIIPLFQQIKARPMVEASPSLFVLPAIAELFFIYRSGVTIYLAAAAPDLSQDSISANVILTAFAYILISFIFLSTITLLKNIVNEQNIKIESEKNVTLTTDMIKALVKTIDAKDPYTNGHSVRVAEYSKMIAEQEYSDTQKIQNIHNIALLHDIGKIAIPDDIINKPGKLTDEEYNLIKAHTITGAQILSEISSYPDLINGAKYHHERYDGRGYPCGLKGEEIPEIAAIIGVADAYDAMTSNRSYRKMLPQDVVRNEISKGLGTQFHPKWGKIMLQLIAQDTSYTMHQ